jgi:hypothetical protein
MPKLGPLGPKLKPPKSDVWKYNRVVGAVSRPTSILSAAANGTLTPDEVEAVRETAPERLAQMQAALLDKLTDEGDRAPYRTRLMLNMLLGQPVDGTTTPESINAAQAAYNMPSAKSPENQLGGGAVKPSQTGLGKLNVAKQSLLPGQASDMRRGEA